MLHKNLTSSKYLHNYLLSLKHRCIHMLSSRFSHTTFNFKNHLHTLSLQSQIHQRGCEFYWLDSNKPIYIHMNSQYELMLTQHVHTMSSMQSQMSHSLKTSIVTLLFWNSGSILREISWIHHLQFIRDGIFGGMNRISLNSIKVNFWNDPRHIVDSYPPLEINCVIWIRSCYVCESISMNQWLSPIISRYGLVFIMKQKLKQTRIIYIWIFPRSSWFWQT